MDSVEFKIWRKNLKFSQKEAANKLGLKIRMIQYYEKVKKGEKSVKITK